MEFGLQVPHVIRGVLHSFRGPNSNHMEASVRLRTSAKKKKKHLAPIGWFRMGNGVSWWKKITNTPELKSQHGQSTNIHPHVYPHADRGRHTYGLRKLFAWHDGRMSSRLRNIASILHWQAYIFLLFPTDFAALNSIYELSDIFPAISLTAVLRGNFKAPFSWQVEISIFE